MQGQAPDSDWLRLHFAQALALARRLRALAAAEAAAWGGKAQCLESRLQNSMIDFVSGGECNCSGGCCTAFGA